LSTKKGLIISDLRIEDDDLKNLCLIEIDKWLRSNGRSLADYKSLPQPTMSDRHEFVNKLITAELNYNRSEMERIHLSLIARLTSEQRVVYDQITTAVLSGSGGFFSYMDTEVQEKHLFGIHYLQPSGQKD
jgi:ATP-dependent DNA helicase PIF1